MQSAGVVVSDVEIVDRAGADDGHEPGILAGQHAFDCVPSRNDRAGGSLIERQQGREPSRWHERLEAADP